MSNGQIYMCRESAMVPVEDAEGNETPTLLIKGKTTARKGHELIERYPDFWEPIKVDYEVDEGKPSGPVAAVKAAAKKATTKKAVAKSATPVKKVADSKQSASAASDKPADATPAAGGTGADALTDDSKKV